MVKHFLKYLPRFKLAIIASVCSLLAFGCTRTGFGEATAWSAYESNLRPIAGAGAHVAVVEIDNTGLKRLGPWPIDRSLYVRAAENAFASGAIAVVIDVMFKDAVAPFGDKLLAELARNDKRVAFAYKALGDPPPRFYPELALAAPTMGYIDAVQHYPDVATMSADVPGQTSLAIVAASLYCAQARPPCVAAIRSSDTDMVYDTRAGRTWGFNVHAPAAAFKSVPFHTLTWRKDERLRGKVVVFSPAADDLYDHFWIPQGKAREWLPGSVAVAYGIETAIANSAIFVLPAWLLIAAIAVANLLPLYACQRFPRLRHLFLIVYLVLLIAAHWALFRRVHLHLPLTICLATVACLWLASASGWIATDQRATASRSAGS